MRPHDLEDMPCEPRISADEAMFRNIRYRLQSVMAGLKDGEKVYVNGQTFSAEHFRFLVNDCLFPPKAKAESPT